MADRYEGFSPNVNKRSFEEDTHETHRFFSGHHRPTSTEDRDHFENQTRRQRRRDHEDDLMECVSTSSSWLEPFQWLTEFNEGNISISAGLIRSLQSQLLEIKRRLGPASEQCAHNCGTSGNHEFRLARNRCNKYEVLGSYTGLNHRLFVNRSAIKLANIDYLLDGLLTNPPNTIGPFLFCDLCAAPGGFSEYLLKRLSSKNQPVRGFGMSLRGANEHGRGAEWTFQHTDTPLCQYVQSTGADGTGDIYNWDNVRALERDISYQLAGEESGGSMHLVVCDGGMDAQRDAEDQELISTKLVVCQVAAALTLLRKEGMLVVKMFGFQSPSIRMMMKDLVTTKFSNMICIKPISSRPASAERYVVFRGYHGQKMDGTNWRDSIFLARNDEGKTTHLCKYLDSFDAQLLRLNLQTCFEILSELERKSHDWGHRNPDEHAEVDIESFRKMWRLDEFERE